MILILEPTLYITTGRNVDVEREAVLALVPQQGGQSSEVLIAVAGHPHQRRAHVVGQKRPLRAGGRLGVRQARADPRQRRTGRTEPVLADGWRRVRHAQETLDGLHLVGGQLADDLVTAKLK